MADEKSIWTTMQGGDRRKIVAAMQDVLEVMRRQPGWGDRSNALVILTEQGEVREVTKQEGAYETFQIEVRRSLDP